MVLEDNPLLVVCGYTCAGKTTIAQYLVEKYGYMHIEASDYMYLSYYLRHDIDSNIKIGDFAETALRVRPQIVAEKIVQYIEEFPNHPIVISGFRSQDEISWLRKYFGEGKKTTVSVIEANEETRFLRHNKRKREGQAISKSEFAERDSQQIRMGLNEIMGTEEVINVLNESTFQEFYAAFENTIPLKTEERGFEIDITKLAGLKKQIREEDAILIALLSQWRNQEDRDYFTTTRIARLTGEIFCSLKPKQKDNVSRYFNKDFYPYYEIKLEGKSRRMYRLSNTGYSKAVQAYFRLIREMLIVDE